MMEGGWMKVAAVAGLDNLGSQGRVQDAIPSWNTPA